MLNANLERQGLWSVYKMLKRAVETDSGGRWRVDAGRKLASTVHRRNAKLVHCCSECTRWQLIWQRNKCHRTGVRIKGEGRWM